MSGRPQIPIDGTQVEKLAALHCTVSEIAEFFDCSTDTIHRRFAAELTKGRSQGRIKLRRLQWQLAEKMNATMLIFLGKNYLSQRDRSDEEIKADAQAAQQQAKVYSIEDIGKLVEIARKAATK